MGTHNQSPDRDMFAKSLEIIIRENEWRYNVEMAVNLGFFLVIIIMR